MLLVANIINLAADLGAMGAPLRLLLGGPARLYVVGFAVLCAALEIFARCECYVAVLKWTSAAVNDDGPNASVRVRPNKYHHTGQNFQSSTTGGLPPDCTARLVQVERRGAYYFHKSIDVVSVTIVRRLPSYVANLLVISRL